MDNELMARKRGRREALVGSAQKGTITNAQGAQSLGMSVRQFQRLRSRYREAGTEGLVHGNRGRPCARRIPASTLARVRELLNHPEVQINDCHLHDLLAEEKIQVSVAAIRRIRRAEGLPPKHRHRPAHHRSRRERRAREGALVLIDGSPFHWLGAEPGMRDLVGTMDDATGKILALTFRPKEDLHGYATVLERTVRRYGVPEAFYGDRTSIAVRSDDHWSVEEELAGRQFPPHFALMLEELCVRYIAAHSPEAKGRIERLWRTLQDRLAVELALAGIQTWTAAEAFLEGFIERFNQRFASPPREILPAWRLAPAHLDRILAARYARVVGRDNTVRLSKQVLQIPPGPGKRTYHPCKVELRELLDGRRMVFHQGQLIAQAPAPPGPFTLKPKVALRQPTQQGVQEQRPPEATPREPKPPAALRQRTVPPPNNHPWKKNPAVKPNPNLQPSKAGAEG